MPWSPRQHRLFEAAAHNKAIAKAHGMEQATASHLAAEGVKKPANPVMHTHHPMEHEMRAHALKTPGKTTGDPRGRKIEPVTHEHGARDDLGHEPSHGHLRRDEHPGKRGKPFMGARNPNALHRMFGPGEGRGSGFEKGGGREHPGGGLSYLRGGQDAPLHASPDHFGDREGHDGHVEDHPASYHMEANEVGREGMRDNLGSKRKSGYGDPQGGTTSLPETPGAPGGRSFDHSMGHKMPEGGMVVARGMHSEPHEDLADETRGTHELPHHQYAAAHAVPQEQREHLARALLTSRRRR
jgi:hypothetical protein